MNYGEIIWRVSRLPGAQVISYTGGVFAHYPLFMVRRGQGKKVLLSGAVHGDEPAGTFALLAFMEGDMRHYEKHFEFTIFPCVNPWGFVHETRYNARNLNLNREFKPDTEADETKLILPHLERYIFSMDLHETWPNATPPDDNEPDGKDPNEFYLWEICPDKSLRIGERIVKNVRRAGMPICKWPKIYGDTTNGNGVIWYPEGCGTPCYAAGTAFDAYAAANLAPQSFTIETPRGWQMRDRIEAHILSIETALELRT